MAQLIVITISFFFCLCVMCTTYMPGAFRGQKTMLSSPGTGLRHLGDAMGVLGIKPGYPIRTARASSLAIKRACYSSKGAKFSS